MKWNSVSKKPKKSGMVWVIHSHYYPWNAIVACYDEHTGCFTFGPQNNVLPCTIPLDVTHWIYLPDLKDE